MSHPNTHIAVQAFPTALSEAPVRNVAHVTGEMDSGIVNLDFDTSLAYAQLTPTEARDLATALNFVADGLEAARQA